MVTSNEFVTNGSRIISDVKLFTEALLSYGKIINAKKMMCAVEVSGLDYSRNPTDIPMQPSMLYNNLLMSQKIHKIHKDCIS